MKAVVFEDGRMDYREVPLPALARGEALVQVNLAGICATDLEMLKGYRPFSGILGHEFVGVVAQAPEYPAWAGRRVVGEINITCGTCSACRAGRSNHCERRTTLGISERQGVFAEFVAMPFVNLHRVPDTVPDEVAVFTEPLAAALEILEHAPVRPSDRVLVVGAGRLGQLVAQALGLTGCDLRVVARYPHQAHLLQARGIPCLAESEVPQKKFNLVVEASGSPEGFRLAQQAIRPRGTLVLKSTMAGEMPLNLSPLVVDEITLIGSRCGPFKPALRILEEGRIDPRPLIAARYPLSQALAAFDEAARPGVLKVLLDPGG